MAYIQLAYLPLYFTFFVGTLSHLLLFICFVKDPLNCFRNSTTYLIMNLALSDFITCVFSFFQISFAKKFPNGFYFSNTAMLASLVSIFSIAVDRYMLTVHPFKHRVLLNQRRIAIWIVLIWFLSVGLLAKYLIFGTNETDDIIYDTTFIIIAFVSSLIYLLTYFSLRKQRRGIPQLNRSRCRDLQEEFVKTIMIVAFIQVFTLVPASVYGLIYGWSYEESSVVKLVVYSIYCVNFAVNPFLYIWRLRNYRETFRLIILCKLCWMKWELTSRVSKSTQFIDWYFREKCIQHTSTF